MLLPVFCTVFVLLSTVCGYSLSLNFTIHPSSCGAADGEIFVSINGGASPYSYLWSNGETRAHLHDLLPGTYTVTVTDNTGLTVTDSAVVNSNNTLLAYTEDHPATGNNANGYFDIHIEGGQSPFTLTSVCPSWQPAITQFLQPDFQVSGLAGYAPGFQPGTGCSPKPSGIEYEFDLTDVSGCQAHVRKTIHASGFYRSPSTSGSCSVSATGKILDTLSFSGQGFSFLSCEAAISVTDLSGLLMDSVVLQTNGPGPQPNQLAYEFDSIGAGTYILHYYLEDLNQPGHPISQSEWTRDTVTVNNLGLSCGNVTGFVFFDANGNCVQDANEKGLKNSVVEIQPGNHFTLTDSNGFYAYALPLGNYTIQHAPPLNAALTVNCPAVQPYAFSVVSPQQQVSIHFADSSLGKNLSTGIFITSLTPGHSAEIIASVMNISATPSFNDTLIIQFDTLLEVNGTIPAAYALSNSAATFVMDSLAAFSTTTFRIRVQLAADSALNDTSLVTTAELISSGDYNIINNYDSLESRVMPAMVVNAVSVCPSGFGTPHYLPLSEERLRYLIEFVNTSGDTVQSVTLKQDVSDWLDLSTFSLVASSHPCTLSFNGREIRIDFNSINIPDSAVSESESHGYVAFTIAQSSMAEAGNRIDAVAEIIFDTAQPLISDTCSLTLYDCDSLFTSLPLSILACENSTISFGATLALECEIQWFYDGILSSTTSNITIPNIVAGQHQVIAEAITPYCSSSQQYPVNAATLPDAVFTVNADTLTADPTGLSYQWILEGVAIPGATDPVYVAVASGNYTLQVTSFIGCVNTSVATYVSITSLGELAANGIALYPNPGRDELNLILPAALADHSHIYLIAADGRIVEQMDAGNRQFLQVNTAEIATGIYQLLIIGDRKYATRWVKF